MIRKIIAGGLWAVCCVSIVTAETHWNLQTVNANGGGTSPWIASANKVSVEGYILNRGEYMLDGTPNYNETLGNVGAQWQIYIQGTEGDHAGTAVWMGQNYQNLPFAGGVGRYSNEEWLEEIEKLTHDPRTGHRFMPGDKVRVTGLAKFYGGKTNINERHNTDPTHDLTIELVELGAGLPEPNLITLDMLKNSADEFIFDPNRTTGCEYYQAQLVRVNHVSFVDLDLWAPNTTLAITDGIRTFPVLLGIGPGITTTSNNLNPVFDVIGILDQEDGIAPNTAGYRIWVTNYDGNGEILTDGCDLYGVFNISDLNKDCMVDLRDFAIFSEEWLECSNPLVCN